MTAKRAWTDEKREGCETAAVRPTDRMKKIRKPITGTATVRKANTSAITGRTDSATIRKTSQPKVSSR